MIHMYQTGMYHGGGNHSFMYLLGALIMIVVLVDLVFLGMWLWRRIKREDMRLGKTCSSCCSNECKTHKDTEEKK